MTLSNQEVLASLRIGLEDETDMKADADSGKKEAATSEVEVLGQNELLREKVAGLLGATWGHPVFGHDSKWHVHFAVEPFEFDSSWAGIPPPFEECEKHYDVPDYPNDLNACAEFREKVIQPYFTAEYAQNLADVLVGDWTPRRWNLFSALNRAYAIADATAAQHCRAFVKTMEACSVHGGNESSSASGAAFPKSPSARAPTKGAN